MLTLRHSKITCHVVVCTLFLSGFVACGKMEDQKTAYLNASSPLNVSENETQSTDPAVLSLPAEFSINRVFSAIGNYFNIVDKQQKVLGQIKQVLSASALFKWNTTFAIYNASGEQVGLARQEWFSWGIKIGVFDQAGARIATIKRNGKKPLLNWTTSSYEVLNEKNEIIALFEKQQGLTLVPTIKMTTPDGAKLIMDMTRNFSPVIHQHSWLITLHNPAAVDPRVLTVIAAFETARRLK